MSEVAITIVVVGGIVVMLVRIAYLSIYEDRE